MKKNDIVGTLCELCPNKVTFCGSLLLLDCNGDEWVFCNVSPSQFTNGTYSITYKGNFELLKVTNDNGQNVDFV